MKFLTLFFFILFIESSWSIEVEVISTDLAFQDEAGQPTLCFMIAKDHSTGTLYGIVEDLYDCFYTRQGLKQNQIQLELTFLQPLPPSSLKDCLQSWDSQLVLLSSTAE